MITMPLPDFKFSLSSNLENNILNSNSSNVVKFSAKDWFPTYAYINDGGADVRSSSFEPIVMKPFEYAKIPLGIKAFIPDGYFLDIRPRSSTFFKKNLSCLCGLIDFGFKEEMCFLCQFIPPPNVMNSVCTIEFGDKVAQLVPKKKLECALSLVSEEELMILHTTSGSKRDGGFGSSDKVMR